LKETDMVDAKKLDKVYNALVVGMAIDDAYIYAGLTPDEIAEVSVSTQLQARWSEVQKSHEFFLLGKLGEVIEKQARMGKENAITWSLEHMYARYGGKGQGGGDVHIHMSDSDPGDFDTVEIHRKKDS
jgi:putative heme degradation protein